MIETKLTIVRLAGVTNHMIGVLAVNGNPLMWTLELPWVDNKKNISCIPEGLYKCISYESKKFGSCLLVKDVPGRLGILFHAGNTAKDTRGCILVGLKRDPSGGILESRQALNRLLSLTKNSSAITLSIHTLEPFK